MYVDYYCIIIFRGGNVTSQLLYGVPGVTLFPYFSLASSCSVMLLSDNRNIMDYWIFNARYCFEYVFLVFLT